MNRRRQAARGRDPAGIAIMTSGQAMPIAGRPPPRPSERAIGAAGAGLTPCAGPQWRRRRYFPPPRGDRVAP